MTPLLRGAGLVLTVVLIAALSATDTASAGEAEVAGEIVTALDESESFPAGGAERARRDVLLDSFRLSGGERRKSGLDLSPILIGFTQFLRDHGIPLRTEHDRKGDDAIGVSASFSLRRDLPAIRFEAGDPVDSFGAFYAEGFRCAFVWPVRAFSLRLEAGEDSDLGYFAVAGTQWTHPERPLAFGIGIPMNLRDAEGAVGLVAQFRMKLN